MLTIVRATGLRTSTPLREGGPKEEGKTGRCTCIADCKIILTYGPCGICQLVVGTNAFSSPCSTNSGGALGLLIVCFIDLRGTRLDTSRRIAMTTAEALDACYTQQKSTSDGDSAEQGTFLQPTVVSFVGC